MSQEQIAITEKSIHILTRCLHYQRIRFNEARMKTCQAAMFLRTQSYQLERVHTEIVNYVPINLSADTSSTEPDVDPLGIKAVLQAVYLMMLKDVEKKQNTFQYHQAIALKENHKITCIERTLQKLRARQYSLQA